MPNRTPQTVQDILSLSEDELSNYVGARLSGNALVPPLDTRIDEEPQDILLRSFEAGETEFKNSLIKVLENFCWQAERIDPEPTFFSRLLDVVETLKPESVRPHLVCLLVQNRPFLSTEDLYKTDLRLHIMTALLALHQDPDPVDWGSFIEEPKYTAVAFAGMLRQGLDYAVQKMPAILQIAATHRGLVSLRLILLHLVHRFPADEVIWKLFAVCRRHASVELRRTLLNELLGIRSAAEIAEAYKDILELPEHAVIVQTVVETDTISIGRWTRPCFTYV